MQAVLSSVLADCITPSGSSCNHDTGVTAGMMPSAWQAAAVVVALVSLVTVLVVTIRRAKDE
jgi:hypothetical protein